MCVPSFVRGNSTFVMPEGLSVIVPLSLEIKGKLLTSLTCIISSFFKGSQRRDDGPIVNLCDSWLRALRPLSVIVKRLFLP